MDMVANRSVDEWFGSLPKTGGIYSLIDQTMGDRSRNERIGAVIALGESGDPRAVYPIIDCCGDKDVLIRKHATEALAKLRSSRSVSALMERLNDKDELPITRQHAASALAGIRSYSAVEGLRNRLQDADEDPALHSVIAEMLERIWIR
jgi:HEAT repeat protein